MRYIIAVLLATTAFNAAAGCTSGYFRKDGTFVQGYCSSSPDQFRFNNRSSQTMGGSQRDEFSSPGATNRSNPAWGVYDNNGNGIPNSLDQRY